MKIIIEISKSTGNIKVTVTNGDEKLTCCNISRNYKVENIRFFDLPIGRILILHNMEFFCHEVEWVE